MFRAAFFSMGLNIVLSGMGLFFVDELTFSQPACAKAPAVMEWISHPASAGRRALNPPEWLPLTMIGIGGVTMLYAVALPRE